MRAGALRHRVEIQSRSMSLSDTGSPSYTWSRHARAYADIQPNTGRESEIASEIAAVQTHLVRIRYVQGVTPRMRILWGTRTFDINSVVNVGERGRELQLLCTEVK
jgi:SPP1 family predicted phage head-tail adaptor